MFGIASKRDKQHSETMTLLNEIKRMLVIDIYRQKLLTVPDGNASSVNTEQSIQRNNTGAGLTAMERARLRRQSHKQARSS